MAAQTARVDLSGLRRLAWSRWGVAFALAGAAGIVLRVLLYRSKLGIPDSDEGLVGLMVRHMLHGEIPTFFWGQTYGGSQEALLTVPLFAVFGSGWLALRIVPIALSGVAALVVWRVGRRLFGEPAGAVAGALFWIWPPFVIYKLTHQWGFYASGVVYCGLLILLGLRIAERPDRVRVGLFGLVLGLAVWQTSQIVPIAVGVIVWTIWRQPRCLRQLWVAVPLAVLGALPWLVWNLRHDWGSLTFPIANTTTYQHRLRLFLSPIVPMMLGIRAPFDQQPLLSAAILVYLIYAALLGAFAFGAWRSRRANASILYVVAAVFPFIYAIHPETLITYDPGYIVILTPVMALLLAQLATSYRWAVLVLVLACAVSGVTLRRMDLYNPGVNRPVMAPRDLTPLISTLDRLGVDRVYADYWLAYVLTFDTKERIIAAQNKFTSLTFAGGQATPSDDPFNRYGPYQSEVKAARHGFVFFRQRTDPHRIIPQLERDGYRRTLVGPFAVYVR